ncbi:CARDB domain-containing protein [Baekduia sp. Peel2402]|uniref:CARDB domain-containing protein n=1 Tax=Baekduia sp. Peel2402 TaxID=3458296 RepID=UPI00403E9ADD
MLRRLVTTMAMVMLAAWTAAASAPAIAGAAKVRPRADLVVARGTLTVASGRIAGTVVVRNDGRRSAGETSLSVLVRPKGARRERTAGRVSVTALRAGTSRTVRVALKLPSGVTLPATARVCADAGHRVTERREGNNCKGLGTLSAGAPTTPPGPGATPAPVPAPAPTTPTPPAPVSSVPTAPIAYTADQPFALDGSWVVVPSAYDRTHKTPTQLLLWMHGCGGRSDGDIYTVMPPADGRYIALALGGRDDGDGCWDVNTDSTAVLTAVAAIKTHFNIDPRRIVLGGYSSGGDLAYRVAFYNSGKFAGVLAENTSPFRDTGSTQAASLAAATYKFPVVHLAHTEDDTYDIDGVRGEVNAMKNAGFSVDLIERPGTHSDANTDSDLQTLLLPRLAEPWLAATG